MFISKQSVSKYENSRAIPSKEILYNLEQILEIDLTSVLEDKSVSISKRNSYLIISSFAILFIGIITLSVFLIKLNSDYLELSSNYDKVENEKSDLLDDYNDLESSFNVLDEEYTSLNQEMLDLQNEYDILSGDYESLNQEMLDLQNEYDILNGYYQSAINTNILDYAGIDIIFTGSYHINNDDNLEFGMIVKNMTTTSFVFEYDLITVKVKNTTSDTLHEVGVTGDFSINMPINSTLTRTMNSPLTTEYDHVEWFEIYYGGMLVAHVVKN